MPELILLADEVGVSERTLRRAINQGSLRAARPTSRTLRLSLAERGYIRRSWPLLSALRQALRTEHNVRFALLYGSAARGTDTADSDVDVLVDLRAAGFERVVDLGGKLSEAVGRPVDVARLQDVEAEPLVLAEALADGRVLVDREQQWPQLRQREISLRQKGRAQAASRVETALAGIDRLLDDEDGRASPAQG